MLQGGPLLSRCCVPGREAHHPGVTRGAHGAHLLL